MAKNTQRSKTVKVSSGALPKLFIKQNVNNLIEQRSSCDQVRHRADAGIQGFRLGADHACLALSVYIAFGKGSSRFASTESQRRRRPRSGMRCSLAEAESFQDRSWLYKSQLCTRAPTFVVRLSR